jgi:hypothetical protein
VVRAAILTTYQERSSRKWGSWVLGVDEGTAEEFHGRLLASARALDRAAHAYAGNDDSVAAVATAWGADVMTAQAVLWERILIASRAPQRQYFQAASSLVGALQSEIAEGRPAGTAGALVRTARERMAVEFDEAMRADVAEQLPDSAYLDGLPAPTGQDFAASAAARLDGGSAREYAARRRDAAAEAMARAQEARIRQDTSTAITAAYESDFNVLESYLVESAIAVGDASLLTVIIRTELVTSAITELTGLPEDFVRAVTVIRETMLAALSEADGQRLAPLLLAY